MLYFAAYCLGFALAWWLRGMIDGAPQGYEDRDGWHAEQGARFADSLSRGADCPATDRAPEVGKRYGAARLNFLIQ